MPLLALAATLPDTNHMFGTKAQVDPIRHLIGAASAWGGNPDKEAIYLNITPAKNDGTTIYKLNVGAVPVDGFWSVSVYNAKGYFEAKTGSNAYTLNNITAKARADGKNGMSSLAAATARYPNCLPIGGWNYMVRLYRPRQDFWMARGRFRSLRWRTEFEPRQPRRRYREMTAFLSIPSRGDRPRTAATVVETGRSGRPVWALVRRVAKAAAEIVELVEIQEGELDVAALAAGMANCDFGPEREGEFVLKRQRVGVGVDGRGRPSRGRRAEMSSWLRRRSRRPPSGGRCAAPKADRITS